MTWYQDNRRLTHIATYKTNKEAQKEMEAAAKHGWTPQGTAGKGSHVSIGKTATKAMLTGGLGLLTGPSHTKGHLTITYARTAEWLAQRGKGAAQTTSQVRPSTPVRPATPRKPMSRGAKIGCGIVACFVLFILTLVILGTASYANQHPITSDASSTPTVDTQATNNAQAANDQLTQAASQPTDQPTSQPTDQATSAPTVQATTKPTQPSCQGTNGNPWCYNFSQGSLIYNPDADFCSYFSCVSTFWKDTNGYVAECANGEYTHSGGVRGACSRDGGVLRPLYSH